MNEQLINDLFETGLTHVLLDSNPSGTIRAQNNGFTATTPEGRTFYNSSFQTALIWLKTGKEPKPERAQTKSNQLSLF